MQSKPCTTAIMSQDVVLDRIKSGLSPGKPDKEDKADKFDRSLFTERELDIMALIAKGLANKEISKKLFISEGTIANHITSVLSKTVLSIEPRLRFLSDGEVNK